MHGLDAIKILKAVKDNDVRSALPLLLQAEPVQNLIGSTAFKEISASLASGRTLKEALVSSEAASKAVFDIIRDHVDDDTILALAEEAGVELAPSELDMLIEAV